MMSVRLFNLAGKTAIVTGGGSGIGRAIAMLLASQNAKVVIADVDIGQAELVAKEIGTSAGYAEAVRCNVADHKQVGQMFTEIGPVHILVNNAGVAHIGMAHNTTEQDFDRVYNINVKGVYNCIHFCLPKMKENGGGVIINMASIAGHVGLQERFAYSATKGAVSAMTLSVAKDYLKYNIRCNSISPARVHTPFVDGFLQRNYAGREAEMFDKLSKSQPIGRMGTSEEVATLALYLCSDEASFITGNDYLIDGGFVKLMS